MPISHAVKLQLYYVLSIFEDWHIAAVQHRWLRKRNHVDETAGHAVRREIRDRIRRAQHRVLRSQTQETEPVSQSARVELEQAVQSSNPVDDDTVAWLQQLDNDDGSSAGAPPAAAGTEQRDTGLYPPRLHAMQVPRRFAPSQLSVSQKAQHADVEATWDLSLGAVFGYIRDRFCDHPASERVRRKRKSKIRS